MGLINKLNQILIVEDELPVSTLIKMNLTDAGYNCLQAFDGETSLHMLNQHLFDLILLDIMFPKLDGYEFIKQIKPSDIPVIFLTAKSDVLDRVKGLKLGADDYLTKPFEIIELLARVETVLRRYNKKEEIIQIDTITIHTLSREADVITQTEYDTIIMSIYNN